MKEIYETPKAEELDLEESFSFGVTTSKSIAVIID